MHGIAEFVAKARRPGMQTFLAGLTAVFLAACSTTSELPTREARVITPAEAVIIPPPGGPGISKVVSTTYPNAIKQDISLITQARSVGENKISVILFKGAGGDGGDARLRDIPFTNVNLTQEALAAWPDSGMAVSPYYVQNAYGPFGYAIAKPSNGDTCIYAWQRIEPTLRPSGITDRGTIVIRLQLCRQNATERQMLEVMYQLRLDVSVWPPGRALPGVGALAYPIVPVGAFGFEEVIPSAPAQPARPQPQPTKPAAPVVITPLPGSPIVPSPSGTGTGSGTFVPPPSSGSVIVPSPPGGST